MTFTDKKKICGFYRQSCGYKVIKRTRKIFDLFLDFFIKLFFRSKMIDASCLFDSEEEEDDESKKKTPEERKFIFRRELRAMLYGFGDEKVCEFF